MRYSVVEKDVSRIMAEEEKEIVAAEVEILDESSDLPESGTLLEALNRPTANSGDLVGSDPLTAYLSRLRMIEPLPSEQQQELAQRYINEDDKQAGKLLVLTNLRLVVKIAREYQRRWTNLLDLIQEGNVGLAEAVTRYDPYRGVKFTSYAQYWIRAMILNYLMNHLHPVRIGSSRAGRKLFYNLKKARRELIRQGHRNPSPALIAEYLEVDESEVVRVAAQMDAPPVSMDAQAPGHEKATVGELMADTTTEDPEAIVADQEQSAQIGAVIKKFGEGLEDDRDRAIWFERILSEDAKSLVELGDAFGVSKERIRQVEVKLKERFKKALLTELGDEVRINFLESQ